jgi:homogentisate 1,2-dioxygenase
VASRVETAVTMRSVTNSMGSVVKGMDKAMESMNLERVSGSSFSTRRRCGERIGLFGQEALDFEVFDKRHWREARSTLNSRDMAGSLGLPLA